jgi:pimeloyl-ACP methyl ester carboxylesterase
VLGLPRGRVPVAYEVATTLGAPLDVIVVRTLGVPFQPELGMGAIGEDGVRIVNDEVVALAGVSDEEMADVAAIVSRGGRPDLAGPRLPEVMAPTLLIEGGRDDVVLELNRQAQSRLRCKNRLGVVPGATHLFEELGALRAAAESARDWFISHLTLSHRVG